MSIDKRSRKTKRRLVNEEIAKERLSLLTEDISLIKYGGKTTEKSVFYNKLLNRYFTTDLNSLVKRLKNGESIELIGVGKGRKSGEKKYVNKKRTPEQLELDLKKWLEKNAPHVELIEFNGAYNKPAVFYRQDINKTYTYKPNRIKDKHRAGINLFPSSEEIINRRYETRVEKGLSYEVDGKSLRQIASELGVSYSAVQSTLKYQSKEDVFHLVPGVSSLEVKIEDLLIHNKLKYLHNTQLGKYRPDFILPDHNIIIECDGLFWHSDYIHNKDYHYKKRQHYLSHGYEPLFFRSDEILTKINIVESMLLYKCNLLNTKYYGRNLYIEHDIDPYFFVENHLMSKGSGYTIGLCKDNVCVSAVQIKRRNENSIEISRFCNEKYTVVAGGFSKLLKETLNTFFVKEVFSYVDLRYGDGQSLYSLGFKLINTPRPSFKWTNGKQTFHRMKYPGNSGYTHGLNKIWDCGQALYRLDL